VTSVQVKPLPRRAWFADSAGRGHVQGLALLVTPARPGPKGAPVPGVASFYVQGRVGRGGPVRHIWVGKGGVMTLPEARSRAREVLNQLHRGEDPNAQRAAARAEERQRVTGISYVEGDYWKKHLRNKRSGEAERDRLLFAWAGALARRLDELTSETINA